jgi:lipopolysaccharide/colanic/teichoic acid biosynthesis glycosyltransferase
MSEPAHLTALAALAPLTADAGLAPRGPAAAPRSAASRELAAQPATTAEVVLVTRDSKTELARSLDSIREAANAAGAGILFVDLGSTDGTQPFAERHAPGARAVWLNLDDGLMDALQVAATASSAEVLVVLTPTLEPASPDAITQLVKHLDEHPYAAVAAPAISTNNGRLLRSARPEPRPRDFSRVEWVLESAFAIRRADVEAIARYRDRPGDPVDDLRLCLRLRRRGREVHYVRSIELVDSGGRLAERMSRPPKAAKPLDWKTLIRHPRYALRLAGRGRTARVLSYALARVLEIGLAGLLLALLSPLMLAIAIAIRLDSSGPALFRQTRLGRRARPFRMYKFRTMRTDADTAPHAQFVREMILGGVRSVADDQATQIFKIHPDPRVTRVGRLLRRTSLDELPQLLNVLRGDMTLVGFRPPIPYEVDSYPPWYHRRFDGRPGITGLWQVSGRNERSYEDMVRLDIEYLNRRSWLFDVLLLVRTVGAVLGGRGAV